MHLNGRVVLGLLRRLVGSCRRLNDTAHYEPHASAIDLPYRSSSDQSIKFLSFQSGDSFVFLDLPLARIVDQSAAYPAATVPMLAISIGPARSVGELPRLRSALFFRTADGLLRRTFRCTQATSSSIGSMHSSVSFFTLLTARLTA